MHAETARSYRGRLVVLGASNATRGISTVVETARLLLGAPLEMYAAIGHGRSYGMKSTVLGRTLPAIVDCGIWQALEQAKRDRSNVPTYALITDIGNDIVYGASPEQIAQWIEQCIDRLQRLEACSIGMTMLPLQSVHAVHPWQYRIVKAVLFPTRTLSFDQAKARTNDLHNRMVELASRRNVRLIESRSAWYGFDPIHIRMRSWPQAWATILSGCVPIPSADPQQLARASLSRWARLRTCFPERFWLMGKELRRLQPAGQLPEGTVISLY